MYDSFNPLHFGINRKTLEGLSKQCTHPSPDYISFPDSRYNNYIYSV